MIYPVPQPPRFDARRPPMMPTTINTPLPAPAPAGELPPLVMAPPIPPGWPRWA